MTYPGKSDEVCARQVRGGWATQEGLSLQTPVIVKYRDEKTDAATALESWLR